MARKRVQVDLGSPTVDQEASPMDRLYTASSGVEQTAGMELLAVRLEVISRDPQQPRTHFPEKTLKELADSMKNEGVIQPIEVTETRPGEYQIVHGERRWRAAQLAGLETIPAVVRRRDYDPATRLIRQLIENIQREDLNDVDRANAMVELRRKMQGELDAQGEVGTQVPTSPWGKKVTWANVGERVGLSRRRVAQIIKLLDLPESIQDDVRNGAISEKEARTYQGVQAEKQEALHAARQSETLSSTQVQQAAELLRKDTTLPVQDAVAAVKEPEQRVEPKATPETAPSPHPTTTEKARPESAEIRRLIEIRRHLTNFKLHQLPSNERPEAVRLLERIQSEISSLLTQLGKQVGTRDD